MRRSKSPRVVWLPQTNANSIDNSQSVYQGRTLTVPVGGTGTTAATELPLVLDSQQSATLNAEPSLSDIVSTGYRLRRIVGKLWVLCGQSSPENLTDTDIAWIVTAGIIVRRADTITGASLSALSDPTEQNIHPGIIDNTGDPWVWRRSWLLGDNFALANRYDFGINPGVAPTFGIVDRFMQANWEAGSVADGPHVDQKTARLVGPEERLFLTVSATTAVEATPAATIAKNITFFTDFRVLGSLRTSSGNRRNASR